MMLRVRAVLRRGMLVQEYSDSFVVPTPEQTQDASKGDAGGKERKEEGEEREREKKVEVSMVASEIYSEDFGYGSLLSSYAFATRYAVLT